MELFPDFFWSTLLLAHRKPIYFHVDFPLSCYLTSSAHQIQEFSTGVSGVV